MSSMPMGRVPMAARIARTARASGALALWVCCAFCTAGTERAMAQNQNAATAGETLYRERCASCHDGGAARAPNRAELGQMPLENIRFALTRGSMSAQGAI
ncbi:MAG TPA: c-type cytochrome [Candidatus Acidoferrales bacterium]|nr:c-type cytochrome [Candidatus Acidoferrales bacterium]